MKKRHFFETGALMASALVVCTTFSARAASDTRTVQAQYDRCAQAMDRVERSLRRYEDEIRSLKRAGNDIDKQKREAFGKEFATLENRLEYYHNRFERAKGQADKIRDDLKNVSGPTCPSCVESSVKMYCRNAESLQGGIDEYLAKADELRSRAGIRTAPPKESGDCAVEYAALDSAYQLQNAALSACADKAAAALVEQARVNIARADSLHEAGDKAGARQSLDIAKTLLGKAEQRCPRN